MKVILLCYTLCIIPALNTGQSHSYFFRPGPGQTPLPNLQNFEGFPQQQFNSPQSTLFNNHFGLLTQRTQQPLVGQTLQQLQTNGGPFQGPPLGNIQQRFPVQQQYEQQFTPAQQPQQLQQPDLHQFHPLQQHQQQPQELQQFQPQGLQQLRQQGLQQFQPQGLHLFQPGQIQQQLHQPELQHFQSTQQSEVPQIQPTPQAQELQQFQPQGLQQFQQLGYQMQQPEMQPFEPKPQQPQEIQQFQPLGLQSFQPVLQQQQLQQPELQQIQPIQQVQEQPQELQQLEPQGLELVQPVQQPQQLQQTELQQNQPVQQVQPQEFHPKELELVQPVQQPQQLQQPEVQSFQGVQSAPQVEQTEPQQPQPLQQPEQRKFQSVEQEQELDVRTFLPVQPQQLQQVQQFQSPLQHFLHGQRQQQPDGYPAYLQALQQQQNFLPIQQTEQVEPLVLKHFRLADQQQQSQGQQAPEIVQLAPESTQPSTTSSEGTPITTTPTLEGQIQTSEVELPARIQTTAKVQNSVEEEEIIPKRSRSTEEPLNVPPSDQSPASTTTTPSVSEQGRSQTRVRQQSRRRSNQLSVSTSENPSGFNSIEVNPTTYKSKFVYVPRTTSQPASLLSTSSLDDPPLTLTSGSTTLSPQEELPATTYRSKFKFVPKETVGTQTADGESKPKVNISRALTLQRIIMFRASANNASEMRKGSSTTKRPVNISRRPLLRSRSTT